MPTGYLYFAWQIVAAPLVILFGVIYWRFLFHLPPRTRNLFVLAALLYVGGALIVEGISANRWYLDGGQSFEYLAIATIEECFEMLGAVVFIYTLLTYMAESRYSAVFYPSVGTEKIDMPPAQSIQPHIIHQTLPRSWAVQRLMIGIALVVLVANVLLVSWARAQIPEATSIRHDPAAINQALLDYITIYGVEITHLEGNFSIDNLNSRQTVASLLSEFDDVMIISWSAGESSIAIAAKELPFDRSNIIEVLYSQGETQFVIYDTGAVKAMVGDIQSSTASQ
jgi:hypothetical protein